MYYFDDIKSKSKKIANKTNAGDSFRDEEQDEVFSELVNSEKLRTAHKKLISGVDEKVEDLMVLTKKAKKKTSSFFINIGTSHSRTKKVKRGEKYVPPVKLSWKFFLPLLFISIVATFSYLGLASAKGDIDRLSKEAQNHIDKSFEQIESGDIGNAMAEADKAGQKIYEIKLLAQTWGQDFKYLKSSPYAGSKLSTNERLLDATYLIVRTLTGINSEFSQISTQTGGGAEEKGTKLLFDIEGSQKIISAVIDKSRKNLSNSRFELEKTLKSLSQENFKYKIEIAIAAIDKTLYSLEFTETLLTSDIPWLSGADGTPKNIMVLFQNNAELRGATGGSLGSFGIAKFVDGKLVGIDFGKNIFKIDQDFEKTGVHIDPPEVLKYLRGDKTWTLKDSGWSVDGPDGFKNIISFYKKETGQDVDGVIMIDTTAVTSLLGNVGEIQMSEYEKVINAENFRSELESEVHNTYFARPGGKEENEPKKIISDMMPKFLAKVFDGLADKEVSPKILASFSKSLKSKDIVLYFNKNDFQERIEKLGYAGKIFPAVGDYIYANNSNIAGEKSSLSMNQTLNLQAKIKNNGKIENSLVIKRKHIGIMEWPDGINKNFVRLLLPQNSNIHKFDPKAGNFEQFFDQGLKDGEYRWTEDLAGKKVVNFWMSTKPGEESIAIFEYEPGYSVETTNDFTYILSIQKQPGANPDDLNLELTYPKGFEPINVKNYDKINNTANLNFKIDHDYTVKIKFKKIN